MNEAASRHRGPSGPGRGGDRGAGRLLGARQPRLNPPQGPAPQELPVVPFVCGGGNAGARSIPGEGWAAGTGLTSLVRTRVVQCALSRVCAHCGLPMTHPMFFLGSRSEADDGAFRLPPMHPRCCDAVRELVTSRPYADLPVLDQPAPVASWTVVITGGFDLVRPTTRHGQHFFRPNAVVRRDDL